MISKNIFNNRRENKSCLRYSLRMLILCTKYMILDYLRYKIKKYNALCYRIMKPIKHLIIKISTIDSRFPLYSLFNNQQDKNQQVATRINFDIIDYRNKLKE